MSKRLKILFTIPNFDTAGSGRVVYDLVKGLDKTIFDPEICCFHDNGKYFQTIKTLGVKIHIFDFATAYRPFLTFPFRVFKIYKFFKKNKFDIIHSWHWSSDISEPLAAKLSNTPFLYTKKSMGWGNKSWNWRSKLSSQIIAINEDMIPMFFSEMRSKVTYIPLGVNTDYFKPTNKYSTFLEALHIHNKDFLIVTVANLVPIKGIEVLLDAVVSLNNKNLKLLIVGDDTYEYGKALKLTYKNHKNIMFLGKQLDVKPYLNNANLFVIPTLSKGEGLPIAPMEAMASKTIVLGSNVPGIRDVLKPFEKHVFEAGNSEELKKCILYIMSLDLKQINSLKEQMRSYVIDNFNGKLFISRHENLYKSLKT